MSVLPPYTVTVIALQVSQSTIWYWLPQTIVAASSVLVAVIALRNSVRDSQKTHKHNLRIARRMKKHNLLSVKPSLTIKINRGFNHLGMYELNFQLRNLGIGPAIVKSFVAFLDGKKFVMPEAEQEFKAQVRLIAFNLHIAVFGVPAAMAKNEDYDLLTLRVLRVSEADAKALTDRFNFKIGYQSIYEGEVFHYNMREDENLKEKTSAKQKPAEAKT